MIESPLTLLGAWLAAGLTLAMFSFLYGDNPFFKVAEHLYIGISAGYWLVLYIYDFVLNKFWYPLVQNGDLLLLIPAGLGLLIFTRWLPKGRWLSRWAFAAVMGWTAGVAIPRTVAEMLLAQVNDTVKPVISRQPPALGGGLIFGSAELNTLLVLIGVLAVLVHFFFSVEHRGAIKVTARIGVFYLMVAFGAAFGSTTMARMSLLYGRIYDLKEFASADFFYATPILLAGMVVGLILWNVVERRITSGESGPPAS